MDKVFILKDPEDLVLGCFKTDEELDRKEMSKGIANIYKSVMERGEKVELIFDTWVKTHLLERKDLKDKLNVLWPNREGFPLTLMIELLESRGVNFPPLIDIEKETKTILENLNCNLLRFEEIEVNGFVLMDYCDTPI